MLEANEDSLFKIEGVITDIRMINLHIHNYIYQVAEKKESPGFVNYNLSHMKEHAKRVSQYFKICFKDAIRTKITLTPLAFRFFKPRYQQENFLRLQTVNFGIKFVFTDFEREAFMHLELYRKILGGRVSSLALRRLQLSFMLELSQKLGEGSTPNVDQIQNYGKNILREVTEIMSGQNCEICANHLSFNPEYMCYLPPTIRDISEVKETKDLKKGKPVYSYYHESCLTL